MRAGTQSFLTMLLTAVPLLAVPALAIFGIPQFSPMSASPSSEVEEQPLFEKELDETEELLSEIDPWADAGKSSPVGRRNRGERLRPRGFDDDISPETTSGTSTQMELDAHSAFDADREPQDGEMLRPNSVAPHDTLRDSLGDTSSEPPARRSWKSAVRELNRLGIQNYRLEPGSRKETFLFRCVVNSAGSTRVVRQFEAEAEEPLDAVADVIRQAREHLRAPLGN